MKKISAVLLVMVLVGSVAFAGFTGNAEVSFGADLDAGTYGFANAVELTSDIVISETLASVAGEGDIRAELAAELTFGFDFEDQANEDDAFADLDMVANAEITSAKIVGDDWYVAILGAMSAPNFAESAIDTEEDSAGDDDADPLDLNPTNYVVENAGVEVGIAGFAFGLSIDETLNALDGSIYNIFGSVTTPEFDLADGMTVAFGAAGVLANTGKAASGSVSVAYTSDDYSATLDADMIYDAGFMAEVAAMASFSGVTVDLYYATDDDAGTYDSDDSAGYTAYTAITNILSAQVATTVEDFDITVTGKDLVNSQALSADVAYAVSEELSVGANGGYTLGDSSWSAGGEATYTVDAYTASADVTYASAGTLEVNASVESTTLVAGATLALSYENDDILANKGAITASATIEF